MTDDIGDEWRVSADRCRVRHPERFPLGTSCPTIVGRTTALLATPPLGTDADLLGRRGRIVGRGERLPRRVVSAVPPTDRGHRIPRHSPRGGAAGPRT